VKKLLVTKNNEPKFIFIIIYIGLKGFFNLIIEMPLALILHYFNIQTINFDIFVSHFGIFLLLALFTFIVANLLNLGVILTHPLFISLGLILCLPLNICYDYFFNNKFMNI